MLGNRNSAIEHRESREGGFAILMVVLVLVCLAIIGAPFAISMRQEEQASITFSARVRAKLAAQAALSFAIAQLEETHEDYERRYAEGGQSTMHNSPYVDSNGEFRVDLQDPLLNGMETAKPTGVMWGVRVTDEQGKINLKTASGALLFNLARQFFGDTRGQAIATAIIQYRDDPTQRHQFTALTQLREITIAGTPPRLGAAEYDRMAPFLTVHSASLVGEVPSGSPALHPVHPVNINTCSEEVLRALLRGVRLADQNDGQPAHAGVSDTPANPEVNRLIARLRVLSRLEKRVAKGDTSLTVSMADPSGKFPVSGWVSVEGDAVKYAAVEYTNDIDRVLAKFTVSTQGTDPIAGRVDDDHPHVDKSNPKYIETPLDQVEVRLLFTDVEHDLAGLLDAMVNPPSPQAQQLSPESRSAILANAINPRNGAALDQLKSTAPFCFSSFNIYTIEAHGISSAPDGRELARYTIREVAQVAPMGNLEIKIDTQEDFERSRQAGIASHVATWPNATQASDIPPSNFEPTEVYRHGRLGLQAAEYSPAGETTFVARFNGPLKRNTLRAQTLDDTTMANPDPLTTVKVDPGEDSDLEPEGIHVGEVKDKATGNDTRRVLVYPARHGTVPTKSSIPQGTDYIQPVVIEMWVKFDSKDKFDYKRDHFLLDLAEQTFTNRVALYYDNTDPTQAEGDLVLHVCGPTLQPTPAQVRYHITEDTFEPQRWYHVAIAVKGTDYGQMALLIDGANVGRYEPSALLTKDKGITATDTSIPCDRLAPYGDPENPKDFFAAYAWPSPDCVIVDGELIECTAGGSTLTAPTRATSDSGARGTVKTSHDDQAHVEIYGYEDQVGSSWGDTLYPATVVCLPRAADLPTSDTVPAEMKLATVSDGTNLTATDTKEYWKPDSDPLVGYKAADITGNAIPPEGWLPIFACKSWIIKGSKADPVADETNHTTEFTAATTALADFLRFNDDTGKTLSTSQRLIEDTKYGLGFVRVETNSSGKTGEIIKYSKVGVALVYHEVADDDTTTADEGYKEVWYIGYLAGFGTTTTTPDPDPLKPPVVTKSTEGRRGCFGTDPQDIMEGATLRFDCLRLSSTNNLPLGRRGPRPPLEIDVGGGTIIKVPTGEYGGLGIFQLYQSASVYEWIQFTYPQFDAKQDELDLLTGAATTFLVGIQRSSGKTGPTPTSPDPNVGCELKAACKVMPIFFGGGTMHLMDQIKPIVKGSGDRVTLVNADNKPEEEYLSHSDGAYFAFREHVAGKFDFGSPSNPRILKFPSGRLPLWPDKRLYIGSDSAAFVDKDPVTLKTYTGASPVKAPAGSEPERPANAMFDEIKVYPAGAHPTARLWDFWVPDPKSGAPRSDSAEDKRGARSFQHISDTDQPPFYLRIGCLERLWMKDQGTPLPGSNLPFRLTDGGSGHVSWPVEGFLKIDDECFFYRNLYARRSTTTRSAQILTDRSAAADGFVTALGTAETDLYVAATDDNGNPAADDFPDRGYLLITGSCPNKNAWDQLKKDAGTYKVPAAALYQAHFLTGSLTPSIGTAERVFFERQERVDKYYNGRPAWHLKLKNRGILDTNALEVKFVPLGTTAPFMLPEASDADHGRADVAVVDTEFLILQRACLGTQAKPHRIGTVLLPLDHIPTSLTPRPLVRLKRGTDGKLERVLDKAKNPTNVIRALRTGDPDYASGPGGSFDIAKPGLEYGIVVEDADQFPTEGYVQIGNEILAYIQDRDGANPLFNTELVLDETQTGAAPRVFPVLTGIRSFRQRFGSGRAAYLEPAATTPLRTLDPDDYKTAPSYAPPYWEMNAKHIVRSLAYRYHDRFPIRSASAPSDTDPTGGYGPHWNDTDLGYYEFAVTLPGARWTRVNWAEALWRKPSSTWVLDNTPLDPGDAKDPKKHPGDPFDVKVLAQIDGTPGWDDMTLDQKLDLYDKNGNIVAKHPQPVSSPIYWSNFNKVTGAYDGDATSHRPGKPTLYLFDDPNADNFINPIESTTTQGVLLKRGQYGDRIRLRVFFQYSSMYMKGTNPDRDNPDAVPFYQIPWRTPWVDWITIGYSAPTYVMEHREMPY